MTTREWRDKYDVYAETDCANLIIVFRQLYFTRKVAQQRSTAPAVAGRAATKPKNSKRHTASMPTILPSPASPRNPKLSPLQVRSLLCQLGRILQRIRRRSTPSVLLPVSDTLPYSALYSFSFFFTSSLTLLTSLSWLLNWLGIKLEACQSLGSGSFMYCVIIYYNIILLLYNIVLL